MDMELPKKHWMPAFSFPGKSFHKWCSFPFRVLCCGRWNDTFATWALPAVSMAERFTLENLHSSFNQLYLWEISEHWGYYCKWNHFLRVGPPKNPIDNFKWKTIGFFGIYVDWVERKAAWVFDPGFCFCPWEPRQWTFMIDRLQDLSRTSASWVHQQNGGRPISLQFWWENIGKLWWITGLWMILGYPNSPIFNPSPVGMWPHDLKIPPYETPRFLSCPPRPIAGRPCERHRHRG